MPFRTLCAVGLLGLSLFATGLSAAEKTAALARYDAAIQFYSQKLKADPHDFLTPVSLGETYVARARLSGALADYQKAEAAYRRSLTLMPKDNLPAQIGLAGALASQHRFQEAVPIITAALSEAPSAPTIWGVAGDLAFELGDYQKAAGYYKLYADKKPGRESWSRLAKIELLQGRWEAAGACGKGVASCRSVQTRNRLPGPGLCTASCILVRGGWLKHATATKRPGR